MRRLKLGIFLLVVGLWIWLSNLGVPYVSFRQNWPLLVVALGVYVIVRVATRHRRRRRTSAEILEELEHGRIDVDEAVERIRRGQ
ncbi:MAG: DUF5668 domain-containing protein [candidate division WOR-3 bacterium]